MIIKRMLATGMVGCALIVVGGAFAAGTQPQGAFEGINQSLQSGQQNGDAVVAEEGSLEALKQKTDALAAAIASLRGKSFGTSAETAKLTELDHVVVQLQENVAASSTNPDEIAFLNDEYESVKGQFAQLGFTVLKRETSKLVTSTKALQATATAPEAEVAKLTQILSGATQLKTNVDTAAAQSNTGQVPPLFEQLQRLQADLGNLQLREDLPLTQYVNPFVGTAMTDTGGGHSGNTNPAAQTPFGMVGFGPDTRGSGSSYGFGSGGYFYGDNAIQFFSMTHLTGPGCKGQAAVAMMPLESTTQPTANGIGFSKANEAAEAGLYKVKFDNGITTELTSTTRTGMMRVTYADKDKGFFFFDSSRNGFNKTGGASPATIAVGADGRSVSGQSLAGAFCGGKWQQPVYYYATFDKRLKVPATVSNNRAATLQFDLTATDKTANIKIGISSVSVANAKLNLETENPSMSFDQVKAQSVKIWNARLNTIQLDIAKPAVLAAVPADKKTIYLENLKKFYTALYRVYSGPTVFSDVNGEYRSMKQVNINAPGGDGNLPDRVTENVANYKFAIGGVETSAKAHYSGFSMWDTYRGMAQTIAFLAPEASDMMQSLVADAEQCGAIPHWVDGSEDTTPMWGEHGVNVIAGSYAFGARKFDIEKARKHMLKGATDPTSRCNNILSRQGVLSEFLQLGYVAGSSDVSASTTLETVITDQAAASFMKATSDPNTGEIDKLFTRARNWTNIWRDDQKKLSARTSSGSYSSGGFHEGTEPHYLWTFPYDWSAVVEKLGGKQAALARLNKLFVFDESNPFKGREPTPQQLNSGEGGSTFYIGNEPSFPAPWAYNWAGSPKHAQYILPLIMRKNFAVSPGGLPGNDDMGATSGWYVMAALGLYPTIPSEAGFAVSTPQFAGSTVWLVSGKKLRIETDKQAILDDVRYISEMKLNGTVYQGSWLPFGKIENGGTLSYTLSAEPTTWGEGEALTPPSGPNADYTQPTARPVEATQMVK